MGAVTTIPTFLDALRTALVARAGLSGVNVFTAGVDDRAAGKQAIVLAVTESVAEADYPTVPMVECFEEFGVTGWTWAQAPGSGEDAIKTARDAAFDILEEVADELAGNDTMTGTVRDCRLESWRMDQLVGDGTRDCKVTFTIRVQSNFTPA